MAAFPRLSITHHVYTALPFHAGVNDVVAAGQSGVSSCLRCSMFGIVETTLAAVGRYALRFMVLGCVCFFFVFFFFFWGGGEGFLDRTLAL